MTDDQSKQCFVSFHVWVESYLFGPSYLLMSTHNCIDFSTIFSFVEANSIQDDFLHAYEIHIQNDLKEK